MSVILPGNFELLLTYGENCYNLLQRRILKRLVHLSHDFIEKLSYLICCLGEICINSKPQQLKHLRKGEPSRLIEGAVEILAKQAGPVVSSDDTIRVEHGHYIKDIFAANLASHRVRTANKLNKPLSNVGRV